MDLRYPVGQYSFDGEITQQQIESWINEIEITPARLRDAISHLTEEQLNTPYRPGGWTVRQVVHHLPDSHLNSYVRFKLALTENKPEIKPYMENKWAELPDSSLPVEVSLDLLQALHERWVCLLRSLSVEELNRSFLHPESGEIKLAWNIGLYAWHGRHHIAHITELRRRLGW
ncbi:bacillithiol transferase BstA [Neobacillus sp. PS3-34]|uniref:YfiT family bacillithiol transferase n=1 Tax=Neobacillus sp. PS3-34 TaxID=3070678 RepID=UPI0027E10D9C|nr:bacillithiol transferase BstA [Neobacillus sp. PS3-34]WML48772.1 bacillithiol transferase BstA [Neobacillus sp. PS3-34]